MGSMLPYIAYMDLMGYEATGWWYTYPSEKSWSSSVGMMTFRIPIYGKIKFMFQSTNQAKINPTKFP